MATHRNSILLIPDPPARKAAGSVRLTPTVKDDVFLNALLEMPATKQARRSPLKWVGAMALHIAIVAALIIAPLYTPATIHLKEYQEIPLAPPPPLPPPPAAAGRAVVPHSAQSKAKLNFTLRKLTAPSTIPKNVPSGSDNAAETAPDIGGVVGGLPGGVPGGVIGGVMGGILGGTGTAVPTPPPPPRAAPRIVRAGGHLKAPQLTYSMDPAYPPLAREARVSGTVVVDALIDEHGNVVQAHVVSGHPLLINAALKAVLQWKYEPTILNGQPVSVQLQVQVHFELNS